jgi:hypothetical protein
MDKATRYLRKPFLIFLFLCLLSCIIISCKKATGSSLASTLKSRTYDTLLKYGVLDYGELYDTTNDFKLYIDIVNNKKIGVIAVTDSVLFLYQMFNGSWQLNDSIEFKTDVFSFAHKDLNGDGRSEFIVNGHPNMHGQCIPYVFLCDKDSILHYRPDLTHYNIGYDYSKKMVRSYYIGGVYTTVNKEYYRWKNDSLELVRGVQRANENSFEFYTSFYELRNGEIVYYKKVRDISENIYDTALWKGYPD